MNDTMIPPDFKSEVHREKRKKNLPCSRSYFFSPQQMLRKHRNEKNLYLKTCSNCCFLETKIYSDTFEKK